MLSVTLHEAEARVRSFIAREDKMSAVWEFFVMKKEDIRLAILQQLQK